MVVTRRLARAVWLARYWLLWKHRRGVRVLALMGVPGVIAFAIAREVYAPPPAADAPAQAFLPVVALIVMLVVCAVLSYALAPRPKAPDAQRPERPHVKDGAGVLRVYGEVWIDDAVILAWQEMGVDPIQSKGGKK